MKNVTGSQIDGTAPFLFPHLAAATAETQGKGVDFHWSCPGRILRLNPGLHSELSILPPSAHINYLDSFTEVESTCFASHPLKYTVQWPQFRQLHLSAQFTAFPLPALVPTPFLKPQAGTHLLHLLSVSSTIHSKSFHFSLSFFSTYMMFSSLL